MGFKIESMGTQGRLPRGGSSSLDELGREAGRIAEELQDLSEDLLTVAFDLIMGSKGIKGATSKLAAQRRLLLTIKCELERLNIYVLAAEDRLTPR